MPKKRVTSKMVAQKAGVSQTTVSFVLNKVKGQNISTETTERVLKAARDLGYVPDMAARMLARGVSNNIALVLTRPHEAVLSDEFVSYILTGIAQVFRKESFRILVEFVDVDENGNTDTYVNLAHGKEAAGQIILHYNTTRAEINTMIDLCEEGYPIITIGLIDEKVYSVSVDNETAVYEAMDYLYQLGHRSIGAISYAPEQSIEVPLARLRTYENFLTERGHFRKELIKYGAYSPESGYQAAIELLKEEHPPTAIFALNDVMAFGAMSAIQKQGMKIPEDISVIGYDGIHLAPYTTPSLTTIHAPNVEQGRIAAEMLLDMINDKPLESRHIELQPQLIIRDSCGHAKKHS